MADINYVFLTGRLTRDVELKKTQQGTTVATIGIAVNGANNSTQFPQITVWGKMADNLSIYNKKGSKLAIVAYVKTSSWDNGDGTRSYATELVAKEIQYLNYGKNGELVNTNQSQEQVPPPNDSDYTDISNDDLPF